MSVLLKGDRVIVNRGVFCGIEGTVTGYAGESLVVHRDNHAPGGSWVYRPDYLTKIVDAPVSLAGKRVKLTLGESVVVGTVRTVQSAWMTVAFEGGTTTGSYNTQEWTYELLPEPIVLPTGKNALVEVGATAYHFDGNKWRFGNGNFLWPSSLKEEAERRRDTYRVIFPGE